MTPLTILRFGLSLMLAACPAVTHRALAEMISFKAELKGSNEVPVNDSKGTGTVTATYDTASNELTWKGNYSGLTGPATMAHFHGPAEPFELISGEMGGTDLDPSWQHPHQLGTNADVTVVITPSTSPFEGSATTSRLPNLWPDGGTLMSTLPLIPAGKSGANLPRACDRGSIRDGDRSLRPHPPLLTTT